jgi:outer membrane receptor protein involved in Fe transport
MKHRILLATCAISALTLGASGAMAAEAAANNATTIGELVVTAERREENLQSTPVAVSAFSQQTLAAKGLHGGQDLLLAVPNANYTRTNFGGYNLKIRGIGTDVIGFGGSAGVGVSENELPVAVNNFANSDFYDVSRVEVVRGPQGTLYGRNATGGAVDIITNLPTKDFGGYATVGYGNYNAITATGAVNIPLGDAWSLRIAGYRLIQDGFGQNIYLHESVDGRDLGSIRATLRFHPSDRLDAYLLYEHYSENDDRNRVGKQLCISDPGPSHVGVAGQGVGVVPIAPAGGPVATNYAAFLNQGCLPGALNQPAAYGVLNSLGTTAGTLGALAGITDGTNLFRNYGLQNTNLHDIQSVVQPLFKVNDDLVDLHIDYHLTDQLTLTSITGFHQETYTSAEDYNRIVPSIPFSPSGVAALLFPNGVIPSAQVGNSNLLRDFDLSNDKTKEYTEEVRLNSSFSGRINFSAGVYYSELTSPEGSTNYYVTGNVLQGFGVVNNFAYDATYWGAIAHGAPPAVASALAAKAAPLGGVINISNELVPDGSGHQYYDARGGGGFLKTYAGFGEVYYNITPDLKLTLGGRYNVDQLYNLSYPLGFLSATPNGGPVFTDPGFPQFGIPGSPNGAVGGFPPTVCTTSLSACIIPQRVTYREFTGRANLDWTPTVSFTDHTLVYASYSRGYKGGGFNTPCQSTLGGATGGSCGYPLSYAPEFIDAFEVGTKNTMLHGSLTLNLTGFYYNYSGYQISQIVANSSANENINAKIYGAEFESVYSPIHNLVLNATIGYLHTSIDDGQYSIDTLNLTQGDPNYTRVVNTLGEGCIGFSSAVAGYIAAGFPAAGLSTQCGAGFAAGGPGAPTQFGVPENLGGKRLPNTPAWTVSVGAQYTLEIQGDWHATLRGDYYWQDSSWARIYNAVNDFLPSYDVVNATLTFENTPMGLQLQLFVKNAFNSQPITGTYLTSDTSGLFQNVFTLDPRTYGARLTKRW